MRNLSSRDNPRIKLVHALANQARERRKLGQTLLDGTHLITAAIEAGVTVLEVFVSESGLNNGEILDLLERLPADVQRNLVSDALFAHFSPVETPSGILALIAIPSASTEVARGGSIVILDAVQDPGNLGTILRTAAAAGIAAAWLTPGCAQAWSPKALRAGMGAHFHLPIAEQVDAFAALADFSGRALATGLGANARSVYETDLSGPIAWLFGAEGQGLSASLFARADGVVTIPMAAGIESLNVGAAAAICLFEQRRQSAIESPAG